MGQSKRMIIGVILVALFMATILPTITHAQSMSDVESANATEIRKWIYNNQNTPYDPDIAVQTQKIVSELRVQNQKDINDSINETFRRCIAQGNIPVITGHAILGQSNANGITPKGVLPGDRITSSSYALWGVSTWGAAPVTINHGYDYSVNSIEQYVYAGPGGYGGAGAYAYIGEIFKWDGPSQNINVVMEGGIRGLTMAAAGGSADTSIDLVVKDAITGTIYRTNIYSVSHSGVAWDEVQRTFNNGIVAHFTSGNYYMIYLEVTGNAATYGIGGGGSDFMEGPYNAYYTSISLN